jgi:hypothetical protein
MATPAPVTSSSSPLAKAEKKTNDDVYVALWEFEGAELDKWVREVPALFRPGAYLYQYFAVHHHSGTSNMMKRTLHAAYV